MKKILMGVFIALIGFTLFSQSIDNMHQEITISRVRIFLDDEEISSEEFDGTAAISTSTILSFSKLHANKKMTIKDLEKEVQQTQLRLMNSGYFYNATVEIVPPRKNPDKRTVIINVTTGFLPRFGGGGIYGIFGKVGIAGKRNELLFAAGWNTNGVSYLDENLCGLPLIAGGSIFTDAPACFTEKNKGINFSGKGIFGGFINPDFRICIDVVSDFNSTMGFSKENFIISPYLFNHKILSENMKTTTEIRFYFKPAVSADFSEEICQTFNFSPVEKINFGIAVCGGTVFSDKNADDESFAFDLSNQNIAVSDKPGLSMRCIRSGYEKENLLLKNYVMASFEARFKLLDFMIANTFPCNIRPFIFVDAAYGKQTYAFQKNTWQFLDAYGLGLQINFDCPVFAYFNFTYGFNHNGDGKLCFYTGINF